MNTSVHAPARASVQVNTKTCTECGESINRKAEICPKCGVRQKGGVSKAALLLLTFFLGGIGGHKFYLRKHWWGLLYLLFCWTGIPGLVALIEFIIYACTSTERLNEKYEAASGAGTAVIVVVAFVGAIMVVGILAAIALPQYQEYTMRARAAQAIQASEPVRKQVEQFVLNARHLPTAGDQLGISPVEVSKVALIQVEEAGIVRIRFASSAGALRDQTIDIEPTIEDGRLNWRCNGGTVPARFRPQTCR